MADVDRWTARGGPDDDEMEDLMKEGVLLLVVMWWWWWCVGNSLVLAVVVVVRLMMTRPVPREVLITLFASNENAKKYDFSSCRVFFFLARWCVILWGLF